MWVQNLAGVACNGGDTSFVDFPLLNLKGTVHYWKWL